MTVCLKRSQREPGETQDDLLRVCRTKRETRAFYNAIAGVYDTLVNRTEAPVRQEGLDMLGVSRGERVLEIGFGTGRTLARLADAVGLEGHVHGVDLSDNMVRLTRDLLRKHDVFERAGLTCADAEHLPLASACVDAMFMSFVLELFDTPAIPAVLSECRRALRANGRIAVVAVSKQEREGLVLRVFEWTHRHFPNLVDCRPIYARRALETAGFRIERAVQRNMWVPVEIVLARR
jgi:demethylmenaquinone methyltransferase/2-methoxy-6-polyprenyl-1,4-benzoquinol methylase